MHMEIRTIITSKVPLIEDGIGAPSHLVEIDGTDAEGLPTEFIYAIVLGGLKAARRGILEKSPELARDDDGDGQ